MNETLVKKLNPRRFPNMSGKMAAIVGFILGQVFTDPALAAMIITSDNHVMGQQVGDCGFNDYLGHVDDLTRNWKSLLSLAGLTPSELEEANLLFINKIQHA